MADLQKVSSSPDTSVPADRRWLRDEELIALVEADYLERGVRLYGYKLNHLVDTYNVFRKWAAGNRVTEGQASWSQLGSQLYDDVTGYEDVRVKRQSLRRWTRELAALGVLTVREHKNARGQFDGIWWALPSDATSARSSAGSSVGSCGYRRRPESRQEAAERRVRPWCRRSGRHGVDRFVVGSEPSPSLRATESCALHSPPTPTGSGGVQQDVTRAALAAYTAVAEPDSPNAATGRNVGSSQGTAPRSGGDRTAAPVAATADHRGEGVAADRSAELAAALRAFEQRFGRPSLPVTPRIWELWLRAARRGELYGGFGDPQPGLALQFIVDRIDAWPGKRQRRGSDVDERVKRPAAPASIAYFVALLDDASKHWRHAYRHEHGLCRRPELCRRNAWMYPAFGDRLRRRAKWVAYDAEVDRVRRVLNDSGYAAAGSS